MGWPWQDGRGRFSALKTAIFTGVLLPALYILVEIARNDLGSEPYTEVIHQLGLWTIRLLLITLAITPAQRIFGWRSLGSVRRILGVATCCYVLMHLVAYMVDQMFDWTKILTEITHRFYLVIGIVAITGLVTLAVTSTDGMMRRMGRNWGRLHRLIYPIALLGLVHFFVQSKLDITEPTWMAGLFAWLLAWRLLPQPARGRPTPIWSLALLSIAVAGLTAWCEAFYFHLLTGVGIGMILQADLALDMDVRPPILVLAAGLAVSLAGLLRLGIPFLVRLRTSPSFPR